jgi:hypothetical protein
LSVDDNQEKQIMTILKAVTFVNPAAVVAESTVIDPAKLPFLGLFVPRHVGISTYVLAAAVTTDHLQA